jgi:glycosyltransferase involved in cell wall biosynthesis
VTSNLVTSPVLYSICITHLNNGETIEKSMESILTQLDRNFEVVVVDQGSTDGSLSFLQKLASEGKIKLFDQNRHNRGAGRELASEKASGKYVVSNLDLDDIFLPFLKNFVEMYHANYEGSVVRINRSDGDYCGVTIFPKSVLEALGGWRDLNWFEDADIWNRCKRAGLFVEVTFPVFVLRHKRDYTGIARVTHSYMAFRESLRAGIDRKVTLFNWPLFVAAWIVVRISY